MIKLDHIALTVNDLDESIEYYSKIGYKLINRFNTDDIWATLELDNTKLELFQTKENLNHIAYSYETDEEVKELLKKLNYKKDIEIFYGNLNKKSFFIEDINKSKIQLIKSQ